LRGIGSEKLQAIEVARDELSEEEVVSVPLRGIGSEKLFQKLQ